ncbi:uncharacterized protein K452DRAFT_63855 [Aplosporella prunicola CBS 121167]|uniref:Uncharacterized protein n=1 Tax=Aplosporella prunicola CBS 121167 TaxID=1176127 RepID=A0A6A6B703_9PEZI|nr:uncharacterized protein K452DRAFT_63855 [Aplosporella prunicola CBS 121167]KAF2139666.1 hypothetical protein K452DRAFT_63855 [Aplosporella prunicola CBS 121167]
MILRRRVESRGVGVGVVVVWWSSASRSILGGDAAAFVCARRSRGLAEGARCLPCLQPRHPSYCVLGRIRQSVSHVKPPGEDCPRDAVIPSTHHTLAGA